MASRLDLLVFCADDAIESANFQIKINGDCYPAVRSAIDYAINSIQKAISECPDADPRKSELTNKLTAMNTLKEKYNS